MDKDGVYSRFGGLGGREDDVSAYGDVHVLAVDDSLVDRKVIERLLRITSCKVTAVDSGIRALQFLGLGEEERCVGFHDLKVDLIITDYCMPEMSGYELLKKIKGSSSLREIPVVIMSSENILARIDRCLEEGAEDFIVKPVKLADVERLKTCMSRKVRDEESINSDAASIFDVSSGPSPPTSTSSQCSSRTSSPSRPSSPMPVDSPPRPENYDSPSHSSDVSPRT